MPSNGVMDKNRRHSAPARDSLAPKAKACPSETSRANSQRRHSSPKKAKAKTSPKGQTEVGSLKARINGSVGPPAVAHSQGGIHQDACSPNTGVLGQNSVGAPLGNSTALQTMAYVSGNALLPSVQATNMAMPGSLTELQPVPSNYPAGIYGTGSMILSSMQSPQHASLGYGPPNSGVIVGSSLVNSYPLQYTAYVSGNASPLQAQSQAAPVLESTAPQTKVCHSETSNASLQRRQSSPKNAKSQNDESPKSKASKSKGRRWSPKKAKPNNDAKDDAKVKAPVIDSTPPKTTAPPRWNSSTNSQQRRNSSPQKAKPKNGPKGQTEAGSLKARLNGAVGSLAVADSQCTIGQDARSPNTGVLGLNSIRAPVITSSALEIKEYIFSNALPPYFLNPPSTISNAFPSYSHNPPSTLIRQYGSPGYGSPNNGVVVGAPLVNSAPLQTRTYVSGNEFPLPAQIQAGNMAAPSSLMELQATPYLIGDVSCSFHGSVDRLVSSPSSSGVVVGAPLVNSAPLQTMTYVSGNEFPLPAQVQAGNMAKPSGLMDLQPTPYLIGDCCFHGSVDRLVSSPSSSGVVVGAPLVNSTPLQTMGYVSGNPPLPSVPSSLVERQPMPSEYPSRIGMYGTGDDFTIVRPLDLSRVTRLNTSSLGTSSSWGLLDWFGQKKSSY